MSKKEKYTSNGLQMEKEILADGTEVVRVLGASKKKKAEPAKEEEK